MTVDVHCAGAALAKVAAFFSAGNIELFAQDVEVSAMVGPSPQKLAYRCR